MLIFEELEKADRAPLDLLLQVLERGELKTGRGVDLDFTRCFIFMTSNIGAKQIDAITRNAQLGFHAPRFDELRDETDDERIAKACREAVEDCFSPEFINRIDEIVAFDRLRYEHLMQILDKFLLDTRARLAMAGIGTTVDESAKRFLIEKGTNLRYGARAPRVPHRQHARRAQPARRPVRACQARPGPPGIRSAARRARSAYHIRSWKPGARS